MQCARVSAGRSCLMFVVFLRRVMSTLQWSRPETNVSSQPTCCSSESFLLSSVSRKCCSSQVPLRSLTRCLRGCATERTTTAQTERVLTRLVGFMTPHLWTAVCISQASECLSTPSMYWFCSILCCLCPCRTHNSSWFLVTHFTQFLRSCWFLCADPRQYIMTTTDELLATLVNLENEAVQARQRRSSAEHALAAAQQRIQLLSSGDGYTQHASRSHQYALLGSRSRSQVKLRNGLRGNSRSRRSRVQRIRGWKESSSLLHGKAQILWSSVT